MHNKLAETNRTINLMFYFFVTRLNFEFKILK